MLLSLHINEYSLHPTLEGDTFQTLPTKTTDRCLLLSLKEHSFLLFCRHLLDLPERQDSFRGKMTYMVVSDLLGRLPVFPVLRLR